MSDQRKEHTITYQRNNTTDQVVDTIAGGFELAAIWVTAKVVFATHPVIAVGAVVAPVGRLIYNEATGRTKQYGATPDQFQTSELYMINELEREKTEAAANANAEEVILEEEPIAA
jgi:hypothetical protein